MTTTNLFVWISTYKSWYIISCPPASPPRHQKNIEVASAIIWRMPSWKPIYRFWNCFMIVYIYIYIYMYMYTYECASELEIAWPSPAYKAPLVVVPVEEWRTSQLVILTFAYFQGVCKPLAIFVLSSLCSKNSWVFPRFWTRRKLSVGSRVRAPWRDTKAILETKPHTPNKF